MELTESILKHEGRVKFDDALRLLSTFCECIGKVAPVLFKPFAMQFIPKLIEGSKAAIFRSNKDMLRNTGKAFLDELMEQIYKSLMNRLGQEDKISRTHEK